MSRSPNKPSASRSAITPECLALGRRIKELRGERGMTQEELADRSGLFRTYLSRIERGTANPTLSMLHALATAFRVDVTELLLPPGEAVPSRVRAGTPGPSRGRASK